MPDIQEDNIKIPFVYLMVSSIKNAILIQDVHRTKLCAYCNSNLDIEEGVTIFDKKWYHNQCWNSFETKTGDVTHD